MKKAALKFQARTNSVSSVMSFRIGLTVSASIKIMTIRSICTTNTNNLYLNYKFKIKSISQVMIRLQKQLNCLMINQLNWLSKLSNPTSLRISLTFYSSNSMFAMSFFKKKKGWMIQQCMKALYWSEKKLTKIIFQNLWILILTKSRVCN